jgi:hypothetical protein
LNAEWIASTGAYKSEVFEGPLTAGAIMTTMIVTLIWLVPVIAVLAAVWHWAAEVLKEVRNISNLLSDMAKSLHKDGEPL